MNEKPETETPSPSATWREALPGIIIICLCLSLFGSLIWNGCAAWRERKMKWRIVTNGTNNYGYVDWSMRVRDGFRTCQEAKIARDASKKWSDDFDAGVWTWKGLPKEKKLKDFRPADCD